MQINFVPVEQLDYADLELNILATTIHEEAFSFATSAEEVIPLMYAIGMVIRNRVAYSKKLLKNNINPYWGRDIITVCQNYYLCACWNRSNKDYFKVVNLRNYRGETYQTALEVAHNLLYEKNKWKDKTQNSILYMSKNSTKDTYDYVQTGAIGNAKFYGFYND